MITCTTCTIEKSVEEFRQRSGRKTRMRKCRDCEKVYFSDMGLA